MEVMKKQEKENEMALTFKCPNPYSFCFKCGIHTSITSTMDIIFASLAKNFIQLFAFLSLFFNASAVDGEKFVLMIIRLPICKNDSVCSFNFGWDQFWPLPIVFHPIFYIEETTR